MSTLIAIKELIVTTTNIEMEVKPCDSDKGS